jgi:RNA recognition motif-containing protein
MGNFGAAGLGAASHQTNSAASFHQPAEKNQIKLFVGGLAFHTHENDLNKYFSTFGRVDNTIVMRDKDTQRGRGFGFVLLTFKDEDEANVVKKKIIMQNQKEGHWILDKKVDVKSAEDNQAGEKPNFNQGGQRGGFGGNRGGRGDF